MNRRHIQPASHERAPAIWRARRNALRFDRASERRKNTGTGPGESRRREFLEPAQCVRHLRVKRTHHWLAIVPAAGKATRPEKGAYCDDGGISCQFRALEHVLRRHGDAGMDDHDTTVPEALPARAARPRPRPRRKNLEQKQGHPRRAVTPAPPAHRPRARTARGD